MGKHSCHFVLMLFALLFTSCFKKHNPYTCTKDCHELKIEVSFQDSVDKISYLDGLCCEIKFITATDVFDLPSAKIKGGKLITSFVIDTLDLKANNTSISIEISDFQKQGSICENRFSFDNIPDQFTFKKTIISRELINLSLKFKNKEKDSAISTTATFLVACRPSETWLLPKEENMELSKSVSAVCDEQAILSISKRFANGPVITTHDTFMVTKNKKWINY